MNLLRWNDEALLWRDKINIEIILIIAAIDIWIVFLLFLLLIKSKPFHSIPVDFGFWRCSTPMTIEKNVFQSLWTCHTWFFCNTKNVYGKTFYWLKIIHAYCWQCHIYHSIYISMAAQIVNHIWHQPKKSDKKKTITANWIWKQQHNILASTRRTIISKKIKNKTSCVNVYEMHTEFNDLKGLSTLMCVFNAIKSFMNYFVLVIFGFCNADVSCAFA